MAVTIKTSQHDAGDCSTSSESEAKPLHCESRSCHFCERASCDACLQAYREQGGGKQCFTRCQVRRHRTESSAWLVVGDNIYDATEYISIHPGGKMSILKKAGGASDCSEDFRFHSKQGRLMWKKYYVGKLIDCPGTSPSTSKQWWQFWS